MNLILSDLIQAAGFLAVAASVLFVGRVLERRIRSYGTRILVELQDIHREKHGEAAEKPGRETEEQAEPSMIEGFNNLMRYTVRTASEQK